MTTVLESYARTADRPVVLCDFTPPRSGDPAALDSIRDVPADFISVAYNPGKLVRVDSVSGAYHIKERLGSEVVFSLSPRDMNKIAVQSRLLGAQVLGLENVVVLQGDPLGEREHGHGVSESVDFTATELIASIHGMNEGNDYRGAALRGATAFCLGATLDLSRDLEAESRLAAKKLDAGGEFFITQPIYDADASQAFLDVFRAVAQRAFEAPVFWGLHIPVKDGVEVAAMPERVRSDLDRGRPGVEIASELMESFKRAGLHGIYLVPPILRGGARDYEAARQLLATPT